MLPNQVKYAALDAIAHLNLLLKLDEKPDLTLRLPNKDAAAPGKVVDVVPKNGSIVCISSRAATATILQPNQSVTLNGIAPTVCQPGDGTVLVKIDKLYSPSLLVPKYWKEGFKSRLRLSLAEFGKGGTLVFPLSMLKEYIQLNFI